MAVDPALDPHSQSPLFGRLHGKKAWRQSLSLAAITARKIESSLGPMGAYKMVTYTRGPERVIKVTKDAVEVLSELQIQYPAIKTLAESARLQRESIGDGVSTFVVVVAALLKEAEALAAQKVHPNVILRGYLLAAREASAMLDMWALPLKATDDEVLEIVDCGRKVLTPEIRASLKESASRAKAQGGIDLKRIRIIAKSGGSVSDSQFIRGVIVRKKKVHPSMSDGLNDVKIAVVNKSFNIKPIELLMKGTGPFKVTLEITREDQIQQFKAEERRMNNELVSPLVSAGARVIICRAKITDVVADQMARAGLLAFDMIDQQDVDSVTEATGATAVGDVTDLGAKDLGYAKSVRVEKIDNIDYFVVEAQRGSTILLRGSSAADTQDLERVVQNAVRVMGSIRTDARATWGGGATHMRLALHLREFALGFPGKEQMAILAFAEALEQVPVSLIRNFGLNYSKTLPELRSYHARGMNSMGICAKGCGDMSGDSGVRDLVITNKMVLARVYEIARLLLRIDDYFYAKELPFLHKK